ncbi:MAG: S-layer protein, partial [Paenibacillus sp.]|nr:S-layer protein [Paenibacillus sp.]
KDNRTYNNVEFLWNATIERDGVSVLASTLRIGDQVSVTTENGKIKRVVVTNSVDSQLPQNATFAATLNSEVSNNKVSLIKDNRTYNNVEFLWNATVERDGESVPASELEVGDQASVTTENGKIKRIVVTNSIDSQLPQNDTFGATVSSVVNNGKLSLIEDGRTYNNVEFHSNAIIRRDNTTVPATSLQVGDEVRVTTENGKIKEIVVTRSNYIINGRFNNFDTYANGDIYRISIDKTLDNGSVQDNVYFDTITNVVIQGGSRSDLTVDRAVELRINGSDNKVNTIVIK